MSCHIIGLNNFVVPFCSGFIISWVISFECRNWRLGYSLNYILFQGHSNHVCKYHVCCLISFNLLSNFTRSFDLFNNAYWTFSSRRKLYFWRSAFLVSIVKSSRIPDGDRWHLLFRKKEEAISCSLGSFSPYSKGADWQQIMIWREPWRNVLLLVDVHIFLGGDCYCFVSEG